MHRNMARIIGCCCINWNTTETAWNQQNNEINVLSFLIFSKKPQCSGETSEAYAEPWRLWVKEVTVQHHGHLGKRFYGITCEFNTLYELTPLDTHWIHF